MTGTAWVYKVPRVAGSRWEGSPTFSCDLDWPRVALYCEGHPLRDAPGETSHAGNLWLVGSLEVSPDALEALNVAHWAWRAAYPTGTGEMIQLQRESDRAAPVSQSLAGDTPSGKGDRLSGGADLRTRHVYACPLCGSDYKWRGEKVQKVAAMLWAAGVRELPLHGFDRFAQRVAQSTR